MICEICGDTGGTVEDRGWHGELCCVCWDETERTGCCGHIVASIEMLRQDGECVDGTPWMVCPECYEGE
jgi:hypothetical protein